MRPLLILVAALALPTPLSAQCRLQQGEYATPVTASVGTTPPFAVTITSTPIATTLRDASHASFAVEGGLRFVAEGDATQLAHMTYASVELGDAVHATGGVPVRIERVRGDDVFVTLTDAAWLGARTTHRRVHCADIGPHMRTSSIRTDPAGWSLDGVIELRSTPRGRTFFSMPMADGFVLRFLETAGDWTRIAIAHPSGFGEVSISGWVHEGSRLGGFGGRTASVGRRRPTEGPERTEYVAIARIAEGTPIHTTPDGEVWATTTDEREWQVRLEPGSDWGQLVYIPGLDDGNERFEHAWIPRSAAQLELTHFAPPLPYPIHPR